MRDNKLLLCYNDYVKIHYYKLKSVSVFTGENNMDSTMEKIMALVPFLAAAFGEHCEVALQDCRTGCIIAISNGHISGRHVGSPLTDFARKIIDSGQWKEQDYFANYEGHTQDGRLLRSSTFFIKEKGELIGMLCINIDTTEYYNISQLVLSLGGLSQSLLPVLKGSSPLQQHHENFYNSIDDIFTAVLKELYGSTPPEKYTQETRMEILRRLNDMGVFLIRGSVSRIASKLNCSNSSLYRYLAEINNKN